ncbi:hypothetical protein KY342_05420 [Candidatus Woesearchaeota archaeon]|nr:hypothetical protein [Candidatus Woesearchaeota archaeon]
MMERTRKLEIVKTDPRKLIVKVDGFEDAQVEIPFQAHEDGASFLPGISALLYESATADNGYAAFYVGTTHCCWGHLLHYQINPSKEDGKIFTRLVQAFLVDFNVQDILPVIFEGMISTGTEEGVPTPPQHVRDFDGLLVSGYGCAGNGSRYLPIMTARIEDVLATRDRTNGHVYTFEATDAGINVLVKHDLCPGRPIAPERIDISDKLKDMKIDPTKITKDLEDYVRRDVYDLGE